VGEEVAYAVPKAASRQSLSEGDVQMATGRGGQQTQKGLWNGMKMASASCHVRFRPSRSWGALGMVIHDQVRSWCLGSSRRAHTTLYLFNYINAGI